jgi:hypothetical protein
MNKRSNKNPHAEKSLTQKLEHLPVAAQKKEGEQMHLGLHQIALREQGDEGLLKPLDAIRYLMLQSL